MEPGGVREIPLTKGYVALVDAADFEWLSQWKWRAHKDVSAGGVRVYAHCCTRGTKAMHSLLLEVPDGYVPDHKNGNGLDNRRCNLRPATFSQNCINRRITLGASGFRGVSASKGRWMAKIRSAYRHFYLGRYDTAEEAARAYDRAASKMHGEFAQLNFPEAA